MTQATLLIVDDNPTNIKVLFDFLQENQFKVLVAKNGENTLAKLKVITPDLILLDVMMPGIDGFETCRRIKANPQTKDIPVIFMTALADTEHKVKGFSVGAVDYVTKPFQQEEVLARVRLHLQIRELTRELAEKNSQLSDLNASLEQKVEERTFALQNAQSQLVLSEKMSSLGQLVAGIAHEINNPLGCITGNLQCADDYTRDVIDLVELYQRHYPDPDAEILEQLEEMDWEYWVEDFPKAIASMQDAADRITALSKSMRVFSRGDKEKKIPFDLHEGIESTLVILGHRLKAKQERPAVEIVRKYGDLPDAACYPGQLNQVFMNLLANAIDAFEEFNRDRTYTEIEANPNRIMIQTDHNHQQIKIVFRDNGPGITPEAQAKIFHSSFTTKSVGKGTGLGLAIARQIVEDKHGGTLTCNSSLGEGTEFVVTLPME
ncbi:MAG: response regulator [Spirulina sp.]